MKWYAGPQTGDERAEGGGSHNVDNLGHEAFNFFSGFEGTLYAIFGIVRAHVSNPKIDLRKIDPAIPGDAESLDGVLVIFVAPYEDGLRIVGWYRDATVYSTSVPYPEEVRQRIEQHFTGQGKEIDPSFSEYRVKANRENAVLLPVNIRMNSMPIPRGQGGMGQTNVCYAYANGVLKVSPWIQLAIDFVNNYTGPNWLDTEAEAEVANFDAQERSEGFQPDSEVRKAVEKHAMERAKERLCEMGFRKFDKTSDWACYDYTCELDGNLYYVEVKGTQGSGTSVILTKNEVDHARKHQQNSIAVIVHDVRIDREKRASGGITDVIRPWILEADALEPLQFKWAVARNDSIG